MLVPLMFIPMLKLLVLTILMYRIGLILKIATIETTRDNFQEQSFRPVNTINEQVWPNHNLRVWFSPPPCSSIFLACCRRDKIFSRSVESLLYAREPDPEEVVPSPPHTSFSPSILTFPHLLLPLPTHHARLSWFNQKNSTVVTWGGRGGSVKQAITHLQTKQNQENMFLSLNLNLCHFRAWPLTPPQNHDLVQQTFSSHPFLCHMIKSVSLISIFLTYSFSGAPEPWVWRIRVPFKNPWEVPLAQEQGQGSHNNQLCEERGGSDEQVC